MMFSKFQLETFLRTFMKNPKSTNYICMDELKSNKNKIPAKKLHKSARVMDDYDQAKLIIKDVKQPLLSSPSSQLGKVAQKGGKKGDIKNNSSSGSSRRSSSNNNNSSVRVKVLMTKAEAAMLLAKRKKEGNLEFRDVVKELAKIPAQRVSVVSVMASPKPIALPSIFEEDL